MHADDAENAAFGSTLREHASQSPIKRTLEWYSGSRIVQIGNDLWDYFFP